LADERLWLDTLGLFRKRRIFQQLGKAACGANPQLEGINRIRARRAYCGKVIAGRQSAEIKDQFPRRSPAGTAYGRSAHRTFRLIHEA
jgi:hypothetical protein